jgi:hypothetical protein
LLRRWSLSSGARSREPLAPRNDVSDRYLPADLDHLIVGVALKKSSGVGGHPKP